MMKEIPYIQLLALALIVLFTQCEKEPEPVNIPDSAFLNALITRGVDKNGDNIISPSEAEAITFLNVNRSNILDMTGIEAFINLDTLNCGYNHITSLDVSSNTALKFLICYQNQLTSLDVSNNTALVKLYCYANQLTSLDVSNNVLLDVLGCGENLLSILDVSSNTALKSLNCKSNRLTSLALTKSS